MLAHSPKNTHQIKNKTTHVYKTNHQKQRYINPSTPLITTYKYSQKHKNGDHSHEWLNNIQISPQNDHHKSTILISTTKQK